MTKREIEAADIEAIYTTFAERACEIFNEEKECLPQLAAVIIGPELRSAEHVEFFDSRLVNMLQQSPQARDALMRFVRLILGRCDAVVHVTEAWTVTRAADEALPAESLEDDPNRREALLVAVHTKDRTFVGMSRIAGSGAERMATLGPIVQDGSLSGRFVVQDEDETH